MTSTWTRALRAAARSAWALTGTALLAVMVALVAGGTAFLVAAGTKPPAPEQERVNAENTRVALKAADESRALFGLVSNGLTSASAGLNTSAGAVPQIFDSIDTAKQGADQLVTGLDEASSLSVALNQVSRASVALGGALDRTQGLQQVAAGTRGTLVVLRQRLVENPSPGSAGAVAQLDRALSSSQGVGALNDVAGLRGTLSSMSASLSSASANADSSLASARSAARQLRDGLGKLASARKDVNESVANLTTGVGQLKTALGAIDGQLALTQTRLRSVTDAPAPAPDPGTARPLAWALIVGGIAGILTYLLSLALSHRLARRAAADETLTDAAPTDGALIDGALNDGALNDGALNDVAAGEPEAADPGGAETAPDTTPRGLPLPALAAATTSGDIFTIDQAQADEQPTGSRRVAPPADATLAGVAAQSHSDNETQAEATDQPGKRSKSGRRRFAIDRSTDTNPWLSVSISGSSS
ncbi:hypothetical protein TSST111916_11590 [Tsukamurella strandjordii]|uniref:hypothetical protein n=1 Tax=Tsukamurella TaxID=2060 RepID=UPI001C7D9961|nr:hypothetical protein [Tsukamurella sp. TY48]GIZ96318.1 hypothetical protein TTY48_09300 [Tsukamurella sp. TY48]